MNTTQFSIETEEQGKQLFKGKACIVQHNGTILVECEGEKAGELYCDVLQTSEGARLHLAAGDKVLVWLPESDEERGVVLGRIGPSREPSVETEKAQETPDELVIEAKNNLTLKCGDGSITLRKDGKILIKGKDLVSQAKRTNRIKGGSVAIN